MLLSRRMGLLLAALAIIALPVIFNDTYWRTNLTICAINVYCSRRVRCPLSDGMTSLSN